MGPAGNLPAHFTTWAIRSVSQLPKALWGCKDGLWLWLGKKYKEARVCVFQLYWYAKSRGKNTGRLSSSLWHYHEKKCLFIIREQICESQNLNWQLPVMCKNQFESLLPSTVNSGCSYRQSHPVLTSSPHSAWQASFLKGGRDLGPPGSCKELPDVHRRLSHSEGRSCLIWFLIWYFGFFCLRVSGTIHTSVWKPWPILGYTSS